MSVAVTTRWSNQPGVIHLKGLEIGCQHGGLVSRSMDGETHASALLRRTAGHHTHLFGCLCAPATLTATWPGHVLDIERFSRN